MAGQTGFKAGASDPRGITHIGHRDQLVDFLQAIDEGRPPVVDGREGRKSVEIIRAIYRSAETGAQVMLPLAIDWENASPIAVISAARMNASESLPDALADCEAELAMVTIARSGIHPEPGRLRSASRVSWDYIPVDPGCGEVLALLVGLLCRGFIELIIIAPLFSASYRQIMVAGPIPAHALAGLVFAAAACAFVYWLIPGVAGVR